MATNGHAHTESSAPKSWPDHALRTYLRHSTLPKLPKSPRAPTIVERRRSHGNWLKVRYRPERTFQVVQRIDDTHWLPGLQRYLSTVIDNYDASIEDNPGEWITAPAKPSSDRVWHLPSARFEPPSDLGKITSIIDEIVLRTNERAMHVNNPHEASREWTWIMNDEFEHNVDRALMRSFSWMSWLIEEDSGMSSTLGGDLSPPLSLEERGISSPLGGVPSPPLSLEGRGNPTIALFVQAPWILTKEDFKLFWTLESMPRANRFNEPTFNSAQRLWAKIWDECRRKNCHWFMLTNHDWWVFGVFSPDWSTAGVARPLRCDHGSAKNNVWPTLHEMVFYWVSSSMALPSTYEPFAGYLTNGIALPPYYLEDTRLFELSFEASDEDTGTPVPTINPRALRPPVEEGATHMDVVISSAGVYDRQFGRPIDPPSERLSGYYEL